MLRALRKVGGHIAEHSLTRTGAWLNPTLHLHTTNLMRFIKTFLHIFNESANKHNSAALDGVAPYLNTKRFLPPPRNHVTHGVQKAGRTSRSSNPGLRRFVHPLLLALTC